MWTNCKSCGNPRCKPTRFGWLCFKCYAKKKYAADKSNKFEQIERRHVKFKIEERVVDGQLVKVKICPSAAAEGSNSGLYTRPFFNYHAKPPHSSKGKYRRS